MEEREQAVYADYYIVIPQIQKYYYAMLEMFRVYYELRINKKDNLKLKNKIQSYIVLLTDLLKNYNSIKKSKKMVLFDNQYYAIDYMLNTVVIKTSMNLRMMSFEGLVACKEAIIKAHFELGLSNIEKDPALTDPNFAMTRTSSY